MLNSGWYSARTVLTGIRDTLQHQEKNGLRFPAHDNLINSVLSPVSIIPDIGLILSCLIINISIMENINNFSAEQLQKCPYHQMLNGKDNDRPIQNENTGGWGGIDPNDEDGTSPKRNEIQETTTQGVQEAPAVQLLTADHKTY